MSLSQKIDEYVSLGTLVASTNEFQVNNFSEVTLKSSDQKTVISKKEWMEGIDISIWITAIRNKASARRLVLKQEIIDILNSGV